jgi:sulfite reductase (NADPH) hemoprotein beta-component
MPVVDEVRTLGRARLSFADASEIDAFADTLERFERGEIGPDAWRAFRLTRGTYGQRQSGDVQMLRVKIPQGILDANQLRALADVAERHSRGFGHVTTRQNLQLHFLKLHDVEAVMRRLAEAGLTTREACGNAVRNVTACPFAGVAADEAFDVTPYAEAVTRHLLRHPLSSSLPRKFKIAFEGCPDDHAFTAINDIGFRATLGDGTASRAFRVTVGGGTSTLSTSGSELAESLPAAEILAVAEAIVRLFHRLGDYQHKQRNRMKFLIRSMGWEAWRAEFERTLAEVRGAGSSRLPFDPERPPVEAAPDWTRPSLPTVEAAAERAATAKLRGPGFTPVVVGRRLPVASGAYAAWMHTNARPQKQAGYAIALVTLPLGDVTGAQLRVLADLALALGDGSVRTSHDQNLMLRWVRIEHLPALYDRLAAAGLGLPGAGTLADVTSCPGAEACRLAVTQSRGLGRLLADHLQARPQLVQSVAGLNIKISGCPNGCGQHHVAGLGLQGSVRRLGDRVVPQYFLMVGGGVARDGAHFGRLAAKLPVRRVPEAVERLVALYGAERAVGETAESFFRRVEPARIKDVLADLERLSLEDTLPSDFVDLGDDADFKLETMEGECSA